MIVVSGLNQFKNEALKCENIAKQEKETKLFEFMTEDITVENCFKLIIFLKKVDVDFEFIDHKNITFSIKIDQNGRYVTKARNSVKVPLYTANEIMSMINKIFARSEQ